MWIRVAWKQVAHHRLEVHLQGVRRVIVQGGKLGLKQGFSLALRLGELR